MKPPAKPPLGGAISNRAMEVGFSTNSPGAENLGGAIFNRAKEDGAQLQVAPPRSGHGAENLGGAISNRAGVNGARLQVAPPKEEIHCFSPKAPVEQSKHHLPHW